MATYYGTYGQKVQYLASDPSDPQIGQVWYNSTSAVLKVRSATTAGTFASGGNLGSGGYAFGYAGTQTAALAFGGAIPNTAVTEEFNISSSIITAAAWASGGNLGTSRYGSYGAGTQTAGLGFGGYVPGSPNLTNATEEYDGSAWTAGGNLGTGRYRLAGAGIQTAGLAFGGDTGALTAATEEFTGPQTTATASTLTTS